MIISWDCCDGWLAEFERFCEIFFSDEWTDSPEKTYAVYGQTDCRYYRGCVYIRSLSDDTFKAVFLGGYPSCINWLSDEVFICNSHIYGPTVINAKKGAQNTLAENGLDSGCKVDENGNFVVTDGDTVTIYTKEELISQFGK